MRIITGQARGKKLVAPGGVHTRPTTDRTKESIFNIIQFDIEGRAVLDLFCGSGQMGLEALSRGARHCLFCDNDRQALDAAGKNIAACGFQDISKLASGDALALVAAQKKGSFGLIFLDPPYSQGLMEAALGKIMQFDILCEGGIIVCEDDRSSRLPTAEAPYRQLREYNYGRSRITTWTRD